MAEKVADERGFEQIERLVFEQGGCRLWRGACHQFASTPGRLNCFSTFAPFARVMWSRMVQSPGIERSTAPEKLPGPDSLAGKKTGAMPGCDISASMLT